MLLYIEIVMNMLFENKSYSIQTGFFNALIYYPTSHHLVRWKLIHNLSFKIYHLRIA